MTSPSRSPETAQPEPGMEDPGRLATVRDWLRGWRLRFDRLWRLAAFGFELLILTRLLERHRPVAESVTAALLKSKSIGAAPPELKVCIDNQTVDSWTHGFTAVNAALFLNLRCADSLSPCRHAHPAPPFRAVYLWDSAFIAQVWKWWEPEVAWDILNSVIRLRDGDRLQHFASEFSRSRFTQPPLIAWSVERLLRATDPETAKAWAAAAYEPLRAYHTWLRTNRRLANGLYAWAHAYESGVENAPRFSTRDERRLDDTRRLAAPDFSAYMVLHCEALASLARRLKREEDAADFDRQADAIRVAMNSHLWDEADGLYYDRDVRTGRFVRSRTIASLLPLWAGVPRPDQARRLRDHAMDPAGFGTAIPLPSVAFGDPAFEKDMWRGPVWVNTAFAVLEGLRRYGFHEAAGDLAFRLCDGVYQTYAETGRFYEFYDPEGPGVRDLHRKRGNRFKKMTLGSGPVVDFVGWTGLVNTVVADMLFGLHQTASGLAVQPRFPPQARGGRYTLCLPHHGVEIEIDVGANGQTQVVTRGRFKGAFNADFGETILLGGDDRAEATA
jgi:hypothetical protein